MSETVSGQFLEHVPEWSKKVPASSVECFLLVRAGVGGAPEQQELVSENCCGYEGRRVRGPGMDCVVSCNYGALKVDGGHA